MSTETTVKRRSRPRKVAGEDEVVIADSSTLVAASTKKTRARKTSNKPIEDVTPDASTQEVPKIKKPREVKKKEASKTTSASKRTAKTSGNELQLEVPSDNASQILQQATAFADGRREAIENDAAEPATQSEDLEQKSKPNRETIDPMPSSTQSGELNKANKKTPGKALPEPESTVSTSRSPAKPRSFLNSFLNEPEHAPVHRLPEQQEQSETPEESRADLKQATRNDFEDSILTARGTVKAQPQQMPHPTSIPPAVAALMESSNSAFSSAHLRAFTTSSFAALKASSRSTPTTPNATTSTTRPIAPSAATTSPPKAAPGSCKVPSKPPPPSSAPSLKPSAPAPAPPSATTAAPPPTTAPPALRAYPSGSLPQSPPRRSPPTPPPRPTELSYDQLQKNTQYKSLRRRWTAVMVSIPFLVYSSYELWRRWDRGDFGRAKMERDRRVGIEEDLAGFDRATAGGSGRRVRVAETLVPREEISGALLDGVGGQSSELLVDERKGMETVSGRQQSTGAAKDIEAGREDGPVLGRLPRIEIEPGSSEGRRWLQEGGPKRGWVQVFK